MLHAPALQCQSFTFICNLQRCTKTLYMDMTQRKMISMKAPLALYLRCCPPHCHYIISHAVLGCAVFVDIRTPRPPSADCLAAGGWLRCCRPCAGGASGAWLRPGHRNHPSHSHILGTGVAQHWRQWDRPCTCPVIAPFITCPHVASSLHTLLDSLGSTAQQLLPLQCAA